MRAEAGIGVTILLIIGVLVSLSSVLVGVRVLEAASTGEDTIPCYLSAVGTSVLRPAGTQVVEWICPIKGQEKITEADLLQEINTRRLPENTVRAYGGAGIFEDEEFRIKYNANKYVADAFKDCYIKSGLGDAELFDKWYSFVGMPEPPRGEERSAWERYVSDNIPEYKGPPVVCGVCNVFYFDDAAKARLGDEVDGLNLYLQRHPWGPDRPQSIWEFMELNANGDLFAPDYKFEPKTIKDPLAVLFFRVEVHQLTEYAQQGANWALKGIFTPINFAFGSSIDPTIDEDEGEIFFSVTTLSEATKQCVPANSFSRYEDE